MIKFHKLEIKNGRVYDHAEIPLEGQGLVSITGKNGAGKSFIWAVLETLFYGSTPTGHSGDELIGNPDEDASFTVLLSKDSKLFEISLERKKKKWRYKILADGNDITPHSQVDTKRELKDFLGLTRQEFHGSVHLAQGLQHILIEGKPADRKNYISDFFGLDQNYDAIQIKAKEHLQKTKIEIQKLSELAAQAALVKDQISSINIIDQNELKKRLFELDHALDACQEDIQYLEKASQNCIAYSKYAPLAKKYVNPQQLLKEKQAEKARLSAHLENYKASQSRTKLVQEHNSKIHALDESIKKIKDWLLASNTTSPPPHHEILAEIATLDLAYKDYEKFKSIEAEISNLPCGNLIDTAAMEKTFTELSVTIAQIKKQIELAEQGKCPTCGTNFSTDPKILKQQEEKLKNDFYELKQILEKNKFQNASIQKRIELEKFLAKRTPFNEHDAQKLKYLQSIAPAVQQLEVMQATRNGMQFLAVEEHADFDICELNKKFTQLDQEIVELELCFAALQQLPAEPADTLMSYEEKIKNSKNTLNELNREKNAYHMALGEAESSAKLYISLTQRLNDMEIQLENMVILKRRELFWNSISQAYGIEGIKLKQLSRIMDLVIQRLPFYTNRLFSERGLSFNHKCESGSVEIFVERSQFDESGKLVKQFTHDISALSGGEKKRLSVAFVLTLADCVPKHKKSNILILDEIDANLDQEGQSLFGSELLPALKNEYESIFVISHSEGLQQSAVYNQNWKITKTNHRSKILKT